jgi:hypothetical protein
MSPGTSGSSAARADENGAPASAVQNSSAHSAGNGMPGIAISPTVPIPSTSQAIMTWRPREQVRQAGQQRTARDRRQVPHCVTLLLLTVSDRGALGKGPPR